MLEAGRYESRRKYFAGSHYQASHILGLDEATRTILGIYLCRRPTALSVVLGLLAVVSQFVDW